MKKLFITIIILSCIIPQTTQAIDRVLTITAIGEDGGNIIPKGEVSVISGRNKSFLIVPVTGFEIAYLIVDGKMLKPEKTYTFSNVTENHSIRAIFKRKKQYTIAAIAGENGSITPSGQISVYEYNNQTFNIIPDPGFSIKKMIVDDIEVKPQDEYTFWDVIDNHVIKVSFSPLQKFQINAQAGFGGSIEPSGEIIVNEHSEQAFKIIPQSGFMIKEVYIDHNPIGPKNFFILPDVRKDFDINVYFFRSRSVTGQVTDFETKEGLAGSVIEAWSPELKSILNIAFSDSEGRYTLNNIPQIDHLVLRCNPPSDMPLTMRIDDNSISPDDGTQIPDDQIVTPDRGTTTNPDGMINSTGIVTDAIQGDIIHNLIPDDNRLPGANLFADLSGDDSSVVENKLKTLPIRQSKYPSQFYRNKLSMDEADLLSTMDQSLTGINFQLKAYDNIGFRGRVHDGTDGVANVKVVAFSAKQSFTKFAMTDENGDYTINYMIPSSDYMVTAEFPDLNMQVFYTISRNQTIGIDSPETSALVPNFATMITPSSPYLNHIDLIFDSGAEISGHVYNARGHPIPFIRVNAWSDTKQRGNIGITDKTGLYTIRGLIDVLPLNSKIDGYIVDVRNDKYPYQAFDQVSDPSMARRIATGRTDIDFYLSDGFSISGQVRPVFGPPLENVPILVHSLRLNIQRKTLTRETGYYTFAGLTPSNDYRVAAFAPNYPVQFYNQQSSPMMAASIDISNQDAVNIDFLLDRGAVIQGSVQFDTPVGRPPKVIVHIWSFSTETGGIAMAELDGSFMMAGLNENVNDYMIMAKAEDFPDAYYCDNGDDNPENDTVYERRLAQGVAPSDKEHILILSSGYSISGIISCKSSMMIPAVRVKLWSEQAGVFKFTKALLKNNQYMFEFKGLASGTYEILVDENNYTSEKQMVTIIDQNHENVNFDLEEIQGREISGIIYNLPEGETVSIHAWSLSLGTGKQVRIKGMGNVIYYNIKGLTPSSDYRMEMISDRYPTQIYDQQTTVKNATIIDISNNDVRGIDFTIDQTSGDAMIAGTITFPQSAEIGESVRINAHSKFKRMSTSTDITLGEINPVPYTLMGLVSSDEIILSIWPEHYPHQFYDQQERGELATFIDTSDDYPDIINFVLDAGRSISGTTVDADGQSVDNVRVSVFSESTGSRGFAFSNADGTFQISGLKPGNDFILMAFSQTMGHFFYDSDENSVRNRSDASALDLSDESIENIVFSLSEGYAISGTVEDYSGILLENVRVEAWSDTLNAGNSTFTDENGEFVIQGLPSGMDYDVTARPDKHLSYQSQTKTYVETGTSDIQFLLSSMETFSLSGVVTDSALSPVSCVTVKLCPRDNLNDCAWDQTDDTGQYEILGLTGSSNYQLDVIPDSDCSMAFLRIYPLAITSHTTRDITLTTGASLSGTVLAESNSSPVSNALIQILSESTGFFQKTTTGVDGTYEISNAPDVSDFEMTASADGFIDSSLTNQIATSDLDFSLETAGIISGQVTDASSGEYIEGAVVEIYSVANQNTSNYGGIALSDDSGNYVVEQLIITDASGDTVSDYKVTAHATGYPEQVLSGNMAGDTVNIYLYAGSSDIISLSITDSSGLMTDTAKILLWIYEDSSFVGRKFVDGLTDFSITNLSSESQYQFLLTAYDDTTEILSQWASSDGTGVSSQDQAGTFSVDDTLNFVFQTPLKRSVRNSPEKGPGPVRNLRSTTHDYRHIYRRLRSSTNSDTSTVSNNPNITVTWDEPEAGEDNLSGYYADFNTDDNYEHTTVNTVDTPMVRTRKITSADLAGDDVYYYFHVASVDVEGRVGSTTSIAFRIDTVAPTNVNVCAPDSTTDRNIALVLGATGASDVYVSNINYAESGSWDNLATEKEWKLTRGDGIKTIYVRFRDAAGNTSDTMTVTTYEEIITNSGPMISDRTFTITDSLTDDLFIGQIEASDADNDSLTFAFETNAPEQGFKLIYDSGLLFINNADTFPTIPQTYNLTVTVQDSEEVASAAVRVNVSVGNYPPEISDGTYTINEHFSQGSTIGVLDALDQDGDSLVYSIIDGNDQSIFSLTSDTGVLPVASEEMMDYEVSPTYVLTVGVSDNQITSTAQITINLNNINDNAPLIQSTTFQLQENPDENSLIGNLSASDADGQTPVCSIQSGNDAMGFDIQNCQLFVNDPSVFDFEVLPNQYHLEILVSDGSFSNAADISVNVININDLAPEISAQTCTVTENSSIDFQVYTIIATDPDNLSPLTFQFVNAVDLPFQLNTQTGIIRVAGLIDYESQKNYTCTVAVFDNQYTSTALLTIDIINQNDNAPVIADHYFNIFENAANDSIIGNITAMDADGDTLSYSLSQQNTSFEILDQNLKVSDNQIIETYEQGGVIMLTVSVSDGLFTSHSNIFVSITPVNDHAPVINDFQCDVPENIDIGTSIITVSGLDADFDPLTYTFINQLPQFFIHPQTAEITIASSLDFETQTTYTLTVQVWDGQFTDTGEMVIHVQNMNDNPPSASDQVCTIEENSPAETIVCQIEASDLDNNLLSYQILTHTDVFDVADSRHIVVENGALLDFEQVQAYTVQTAITDGKYTIYQQSRIHILNVNDNLPEIIAQSLQTLEDQPLTTCMQLTDPDMDSLTLTIDTQGNLGHAELIDQYCLQYTPFTNVYGNDIILLSVFDGLHEILSEACRVTITSVDDPPVLGTLPYILLQEDSLSSPYDISVIDVDTPMEYIQIEIVSNNIDLIPNSSEYIRLSQVDTGYILQIKPTANASGSAQLTIYVRDESTQITGILQCKVQSENDPPLIAPLADIVLDEDTISAPVSISVSDNDTAFEALFLTVFSDNQTLIPNHINNLNLSIADDQWTLIITPASDQFGQANITVVANDGIQTSSISFLVTVNAVNDQPQIDMIADQLIDEDHVMGPLALNIVDIETATNELSVQLISNNTDLIPAPSIQLRWNNDTWELQIEPAVNTSGMAQLTVTVSDGAYTSATNFALTVTPVNDPPETQPIQTQHIQENESSGPITLEIHDPESPLNELMISLTSSNPDLLPINEQHAGIISQSLFLTPVMYASGEAMISITVSDGEFHCQTSFLLEVSSVNQAPEISDVNNQSFDEDTVMSPLRFTVVDIESPIESLQIRVESSNRTLFPQDAIDLSYHDHAYWLVLSPPLNLNGNAQVTIYADDGIDEASKTFTVNVLPVEDPPVLTPPNDLQLTEDAPIQSIPFMVSDPETPFSDLIITAMSDNLDLIPQDAIQITGLDTARTLNISIAPGHFGRAQIRLTVTDSANYTDSYRHTITVVRGNTLSFNGENDYVEIPDHDSLHIENTLTAEVWIETCTITSQKHQIMNKIDENGHGFSLALSGNNIVQLMAGSESQYVSLLSTISIPANTWTHIAASMDQQTMILYINGQEDTRMTHNIDITLNQSQPLIFGGLSYNPTTNSFCGQMDDVRLWQVVRTQSQIENYMNMRLQGNETGLLGYWHFKDNAANDHCDTTDNHGIIHKDAPMISMIPDQFANEDFSLLTIDFSVSDLQTNASDLDVFVHSSNENLIPQSNIQLSGTDKKRQLQILSSPNQSGICIITISVDDGETVTKRSFKVTVMAINDAPVLTMPSQMEILEDSMGASLPFQITDIDSDQLSVIYQVSNLDLLSWNNVSIQSNYLELTPTSNMSGSLILTLTVSDGALSDSKQVNIYVLPVNDLPEISVLQSYTQMEDSAEIQLPFEIFDLETSPDNLQLSLTCQSNNCSPYTQVHITGQGRNRNLVATPMKNQSGSTWITIILMDENNAVTSQSLTLTVLPVNDPPEMSTIEDFSIDEDTIYYEIPVQVVDIESLSTSLQLTVISENTALLPDDHIKIIGTASERKILVSPTADLSGTSQIQLTLSDPDGGTITQRFILTVLPVNDAPEIFCISSLQIDEDTISESIKLTILDIDTEFDMLSLWINSSNSALIDPSGMEIIRDETESVVLLSPKTNHYGESIIQIVVSDNQGLTSLVNLNLTVRPVNDAPEIQSISDITLNEDADAISIPLTISDTETPLEQMQIDVALSDHKVLSRSQVQISYETNQYIMQIQPGLNVNGTSQICISIQDAESLTASTCFTLNILSENDPPTLSEFTAIVVNEDAAISPIPFTVSDIETPSAQLTIGVQTSNTELLNQDNYAIQGLSAQRKLIITPSKNAFGSTWISITVTDENGASQSQSFLLDILPVNDPPTIEAIDNIVVDEDQSITPIVLHVGDIETSIQHLVPKITVQSSILSDNDIVIEYIAHLDTYQLTINTYPNTSGLSTIMVEIADPQGLTDAATFEIYQTPVNDPPTLLPVEDQRFDEDCQPFTVALIVNDQETSTPQIDFDIMLQNQDIIRIEELKYIEGLYELKMACLPDAFGETTIQITASDAEGLTAIQSFSVEILPVNDPPIIQDVPDQISQEDAILQISDMDIYDVDDSLNLLNIQISADDQTLMGEYAIFSLTQVTLIPKPDAYGSTQITITVFDLQGLTGSTSFVWQIVPMVDMPYISNIDDIRIDEDKTDYHISFDYGHVDYSASQLSVSLVSSDNTLIDPEKQIIEQSSLYISPEPDQWGQVELCIQVSDPNPFTAVSCFDMTIAPQNDPPTIQVSAAYSMNEDTAKTIYFTIDDIDSTILPTMITCQTDQGFEISAPEITADTFAVSLTPHNNYYGDSTLTINVDDTNGGSDQKTISIQVLSVNDIPVAHDNQLISFEDVAIQKALQASDIDNDDLTYFIDTVPQSGRIILLSDHIVQYTPDKNFFGKDQFSFYVFDGQAMSESAWIDITVKNTPDIPVANAGNNLTINELQTVTLDGSLSSDPDNDIADYSWTQIDGISVDLNDSNQSVVRFNLPDITNDQDVLFQLTVTDQTGRKNTDTITVHVIDISAPVPGFSGTPVEGKVPLEVQFTDSSIGKVNTWEWEFGDGYISYEQNPLHVYQTTGEYSVILTVEGPFGTRTKEQTDYIYASAAEIKADFSSDDTQGVAPLTVRFNNLSEGEIDQMTWDFGDSTTSSQFSPEHTYARPGNYTVVLTVFGDDKLDQIQRTAYIQVDDRTISGTIYSDETPTQVLSDFIVAAYGADTVIQTLSDTLGNYTITGLPATDKIKLGVWASSTDDRFLTQFYNQQINLRNADYLSTESHDLTQVNFYLTPIPALTMGGRVHDGEQGKKSLLVSACSELIDWCVQSTTDSNGNYALTGLKPSSDYLLSVWWEDQQTLVYYTLPENQIIGQDIPAISQFEKSLARIIPITNTNLDHMDMILSIEQTKISGRITNTDGQGIANIWVNAWSDIFNSGNGAFSDSLGNYTIIGLQAVSEIEKGYTVSIAAYGGFQYPNRMTVPSNQINFQIPSTTWISGIIETETGETLSNACVKAWSLSDDTSQIYSSCTDQYGRYTILNMPYEKDYVIQVMASNYLQQDYQDANTVDLTNGPQENINFHLVSGGSMTGQIYLQSIEKTASEGILINLWSPSKGVSHGIETHNGSFQINDLDQSITDYYIMINHDNYLPAFYCNSFDHHACSQKSQADSIMANGGHYTMVLQTGIYLCGNITGNYDDTGNLKLTVTGENEGIQKTVRIDTGITPNFCVQALSQNMYHLEIYDYNQFLTDQDILLLDSKDDLTINIDKVNDGQISGQINGLPENEWAQLRIWSESLDIEKIVRIYGNGETVSYAIPQLARTNDYIAILSVSDMIDLYYEQSQTFTHADCIDISSSDQTSIDFTIENNTASIWGTIYYQRENPYTGSTIITAWSASTGLQYQKTVQTVNSNDVNYSITGMQQASDYIVKVDASGFQSQFFDNAQTSAQAAAINLHNETMRTDVHFYLQEGIQITGNISTNLSSDTLSVEIENQVSGKIDSIAISNNYAYTINGLILDTPYILWTRSTGGNRWFYKIDGLAYNTQQADMIRLSESAQFDFYLPEQQSITGSVQSESGTPISGMWVQASDISGRITMGAFTSETGNFKISNLPIMPYHLKICPHGNDAYKASSQSNIEPGNQFVQFILQEKSGAVLSGEITNLKQEPEAYARVEVINSNIERIQTVTDIAGKYEIKDLTMNETYSISVYPSKESQSAYWHDRIDINLEDQQKDISLSSGIHMNGRILSDDTETGIYPGTIFVESVGTGYHTVVNTDENGWFICLNMPLVSDYLIRIMADKYHQVELVNQAAVQSRIFIMKSSGILSGYVKDSLTGSGIEAAIVHIQSVSRDIEESVRTDGTGYYRLTGLSQFNEQGEVVSDYELTVIATDYPIYAIGNIQAEQERNIVLTHSDDLLKMMINHDESVKWIVDIFENQRDFVQSQIAQSNEWFTLKGLDNNKQYQLRIGTTENDQYWVGSQGELLTERNQCGVFSVNSQIEIDVPGNFKSKRNRKVVSIPTPEIHSPSHQIFSTELPFVSNIPVIAMTWEIISEESIIGYYVTFTTQKDFEWQKSNTAGIHPVQINRLRSHPLTGEKVNVYCHIAAVDNMGNIGKTVHAGPYVIDTMPPQNVYIKGPVTTSKRNITLQLFAQDATETYISTSGYEMGGIWTPYAQTQTYLIPDHQGQVVIYARFRDSASNISHTSTVIRQISPENNVPTAISKNWHIKEDTRLSGTLSASDDDNDSLAYHIKTYTKQGVITLTDTSSGSFMYKPFDDFTGTDTFTFYVFDGVSQSMPSQCTVVIANQNDAPVIESQEFDVPANTLISRQLIATDIDNDLLTFEIVHKPYKGTLYLTNPNTGEFQYIPEEDAAGTDSFVIRVRDQELSSQAKMMRIYIISQESQEYWYTGLYPEGYIVDYMGNPLPGILIAFTNSSDKTYTQLTDDNGYYIFETTTPPKSDFALQASSAEYASIWMPWPQDNPPETFTMLSFADAVLLTGLIHGLDHHDSVLIQSENTTVCSVNSEYTLAVRKLPVDLRVSADGYRTVEFEDVTRGMDIIMAETVVEQASDSDESGCFIEMLLYE